MQDTTFEFEKKRNRPLKYDRELMKKTIAAIKRIERIREIRQTKFWENRMKDTKKLAAKEALRELENFKHVVDPPKASHKTKVQRRAEEILRQRLEAKGEV